MKNHTCVPNPEPIDPKTPKSWRTYRHLDHPGEKNDMGSLTRPDMAVTPQELLSRFRRGVPVQVNQYMNYTGDQYLPNPQTLDLTEVDDILEANLQRREALEKELKEKKALREKAQQDALLKRLKDEQELEEWRKSKEVKKDA